MKKVWVEVELPEEDFFSCLEAAQREFHAHIVSTLVNSPTIIGKNNSYFYMNQIQAIRKNDGYAVNGKILTLETGH